MREIETARVRLRGWVEEDLEPLVAMCADARVMEFFPSVASREDTEAMLGRIRSHHARYGFGPWAMEVEGEFAGALGLNWVRYETSFTPCVELGYRMRAEFWGRGLATEAGRAALRYGFETLGLEEIVAFTIPANQRSRRVMEKLGLVYSGEFEHPLVAERHPMRRHVLYRIARANWEASG
ncbi:MAG TPA: GNAT family N-acetyltransferase [Bryobacteraceae bacterium]|jgi:RimJ/RimL family protein N-acetyltransferase